MGILPSLVAANAVGFGEAEPHRAMVMTKGRSCCVLFKSHPKRRSFPGETVAEFVGALC